MVKIKLESLPEDILSFIASLLQPVDLLAFRLTCRTLHDATLCKAVLEKWKISVPYINDKVYRLAEKISGGKFVRLVILSTLTKDEKLKSLFQHMPNLEDVVISTEKFHCLQGHCKNIKRLTLNDKDNFLCKMDESQYCTYFNILHGSEIKKICFFGRYGIYTSAVLRMMLQTYTNLITIKLVSIYIDNSKESYEFSEFLKSCDHIKEFKFVRVYFTTSGLQLPDGITSLKCIHSALQLSNNHPCLEKLFHIGKGDCYVDDVLKNSRFVKLKHLVLRDCSYYSNGFEGCSTLQYLEATNIDFTYIVLMNLSPAIKRTLKHLVIGHLHDLTDEDIAGIINEFTKLREVHLYELIALTPMFLTLIKNNRLKHMSIIKCSGFLKRKNQQEVESLKESLTFSVQLIGSDRNYTLRSTEYYRMRQLLP